MRTLLVLARQGQFADAVSAAVDSARFSVAVEEDLADVEAMLGRGVVDAVVADGEAGEAKLIRAVRELRSVDPELPIYVYVEDLPREREEELYLAGVEKLLRKPVRGNLLGALLDAKLRWKGGGPEISAATELPERQETPAGGRVAEEKGRLTALRDLVLLLNECDEPSRLLEKTLARLRAVLRVNRAAIYMRAQRGSTPPGELFAPGDRRLLPVCSTGIDRAVLQRVALALDGGLGERIFRTGRILRASSREAREDMRTQREFSALGATVALPITDDDGLLGVALFDDRVTGEPIGDEELSELFGVLEEIGGAVRKACMVDRVQEARNLMAGVLEHLGTACVLIGGDFAVLHANSAARVLFGWRSGDWKYEQTDLPQVIGSPVFEVMKTKASAEAFKHEMPDGRKFEVSVSPVQGISGRTGLDVLLVMEEVTERERLHRLEIEASGLRLVQSIATRLAHEIGNAVSPISAHEQLIAERFHDPEFRDSLRQTLGESVRRITRLSKQMFYLANQPVPVREAVNLTELVDAAFREAAAFRGAPEAGFRRSGEGPYPVMGDRQALTQAFMEVFLNALQAGDHPEVAVRVEPAVLRGENFWSVEVSDAGSGFSEETVARAHEPFFTMRNVGMGLGLAVTRRIVEDHEGSLEIEPGSGGARGVVRINLPAGNGVGGG